LSEVLVEKAKRDGAAEGLRDEIRTLLRSVMVRCPASVREKVRLKVDRIRQEAGR